jgi:hypothetical protein
MNEERKSYLKQYRQLNKDRINERQRQRYKNKATPEVNLNEQNVTLNNKIDELATIVVALNEQLNNQLNLISILTELIKHLGKRI